MQPTLHSASRAVALARAAAKAILGLGLVVTLSVSAGQAADSDGWWGESAWRPERDAFHYYPPDKPVEAPPAKAAPPKARAFQGLKSTKEIQEEHNRRLDAAVVEPTPENVLAYHEFKTQMLAQSEKFAAVSQAVIWANPSIDYNVQNPVANFAQTSQRMQMNRDEEQLMRDLAQNYGLVFFYRTNCGPCHVQVPIFKELTQNFGIEVMGVGLDGKPMPGYPNSRPDNGISKRLTGGRGVEVTPMTFLISKDGKETLMLGAGIMAADEIMTRIRLLTTRAVEKLYQPYWAGSQQQPAMPGPMPTSPALMPLQAQLRAPEQPRR